MRCQLLYFLFFLQTNLTVVTEFRLLGFQGSQLLRKFLFLLFLLVFCATVFGNLLIITLVFTSKNLQTPMYFFISQLSISDILLSANVVPKILYLLLNNGGTISFIGCMTQFIFFLVPEGFECLLLSVMSYDRYVAICNPLRYTSIMTNTYCVKLTTMCWLLSAFISFIDSITTSQMIFCKSNIIDHFFCDFLPLVELACSDTSIIHLVVSSQSVPLVIIPTILIIKCYSKIAISIMNIRSSIGRQKAFSTCSSHLIVVSIFYWSLCSVYVVPTKGDTSTTSKVLSLLFTVFTPLINPIIYSLRNKDIKKAIKEIFLKYKPSKL